MNTKVLYDQWVAFSKWYDQWSESFSAFLTISIITIIVPFAIGQALPQKAVGVFALVAFIAGVIAIGNAGRSRSTSKEVLLFHSGRSITAADISLNPYAVWRRFERSQLLQFDAYNHLGEKQQFWSIAELTLRDQVDSMDLAWIGVSSLVADRVAETLTPIVTNILHSQPEISVERLQEECISEATKKLRASGLELAGLALSKMRVA